MSINALSSVSIYEYYYSINQQNSKKKNSPIADEMKKYGLTPTDSDEMNIALLKKAKGLEASPKNAQPEALPPSERPWADLMYQLNLTFNEDPKDDIEDIKKELAKLIQGVSDDELEAEVKDLENYVEKLYIEFMQNSNINVFENGAEQLAGQLNNIATLNRVSLL